VVAEKRDPNFFEPFKFLRSPHARDHSSVSTPGITLDPGGAFHMGERLCETTAGPAFHSFVAYREPNTEGETHSLGALEAFCETLD
jgi:hypothetical protein